MSRLYGASLIAAVGVTSFWAGRYFDRPHVSTVLQDLKIVKPIFARSLSKIDESLPVLPSDAGLNHDKLSSESLDNKTLRIGQIMKYGFPSLDNVRSLDDFVLSYDKRNRVPNWVIEHLNAETIKFNADVDRAKCDFHEDTSIHQFFRSQNSDYKGSGFDRGHMAAAGNHKRRQDLCEQTFLLSNMAPQVGRGFNRDSWNRLEKYSRKLVKKYPNVYICTGPLYLPRIEEDGLTYVKYRVIGNNHVAVPTHFFKVILMEAPDSSLEVEAYVMPNAPISEDTPLSTFKVPPESIERASGLLFFERLPKGTLKLVNGKKNTWR